MKIVDFSQVHGWAVTDLAADQVILTPAGQPVSGTQVFFVTEDGNAASIFAPDGQLTETKVHAAVNSHATLIDRIGRLTRDSHKQ